jgi:hypothetical protein
MNDTNTYTRTVSSTPANSFFMPPFYTQAFPSCDPGDFAISRGFIGPPIATAQATAYDAVTLEDFPLTGGWGVILKSTTNFQAFNARVVCFNNP